MSKKAIFTFAIVLLFASSVSAIPLFFSWGGEKIVKVTDFPNNPDFQTETGEYIDAGYKYKQVTIFFIPVWSYGGEWVGYIGSDKQYWQIGYSDLKEAAESAGLELSNSKISFWDAIGGKILFIFLLVVYFGRNFFGALFFEDSNDSVTEVENYKTEEETEKIEDIKSEEVILTKNNSEENMNN